MSGNHTGRASGLPRQCWMLPWQTVRMAAGAARPTFLSSGPRKVLPGPPKNHGLHLEIMGFRVPKIRGRHPQGTCRICPSSLRLKPFQIFVWKSSAQVSPKPLSIPLIWPPAHEHQVPCFLYCTPDSSCQGQTFEHWKHLKGCLRILYIPYILASVYQPHLVYFISPVFRLFPYRLYPPGTKLLQASRQ